MRNSRTLIAAGVLAALWTGCSDMVVRAYAILGTGTYYVRETTAGEYAGYVAGEGVGEWHGPGLPALGLTPGGRVDPAVFLGLLDGVAPDGRRMVNKPGPNAKTKRQAGWEWVFSSCKDLDVVWALTPDPVHRQLDAIFRDGVRFVLDFAAADFGWTRRGKGGLRWERCLPVLALFHHSNSRLLDPSRHVHAVLPNAAPRPDGTAGFVVSKPWYAGQRACSALFDLYIASRLPELGLAVRPAGFTYRIDGVPRSLVRAWSKRSRQIAEHLAGADDRSFRAVGKAARKDRPRPPRTPLAEKRRGWAADAAARGFDVRNVFGRDQRPSSDPGRDARAVVWAAVAALGADRGTFTRLDLIARSAVLGLRSLVPPAAVLAEVDRVLDRYREHGIVVAGTPKWEPNYALAADRARPAELTDRQAAGELPDRSPNSPGVVRPRVGLANDPDAMLPAAGHETVPKAATARPAPDRPAATRDQPPRAPAPAAAPPDAGPRAATTRTTTRAATNPTQKPGKTATASAARPFRNPLDRLALLTEPVRAWVAAHRAINRAVGRQWRVTTADLGRMVAPLSRTTGLSRDALTVAFLRITENPRLNGLVVVRRGPGGQDVFTTRRQWRTEARLTRHTAALARARGSGVKARVMDRALRRMAGRGDRFLAAFRGLAGGRSRLALLDAPLREDTAALLTAVARTCRESGLRVRWAAPTAATAGLMAHQTRSPVQTVAALLRDVEKAPVGRVLGWMHRHQLPSVWAKLRAAAAVRRPSDPLARTDWVVVGATQQTDPRSLARLAAACRRSGARLVLAGSRTDLPTGPAWAFLTDRSRAVRYDPPTPGHPKPEWEAARLARDGQAAAAVDRLDRAGRLYCEPGPAAAADRLLARFREAGGLDQPARHRIVTDRPRDAALLNARVQAARRRAGLLGLASVRVNPGCRVRSGDRVVFTRSSVEHRTQAGGGGTVASVNPLLRTVTVRTDAGDLLSVPVARFPHLRLGYADPLRSLTAQAPHLYALVRGPGFSRQAANVLLAHPREWAELFTDRTPPELAHLMARDDQRAVRVRDLAPPRPEPRHDLGR